jgi:hypothetical protein
VATSAAIPGLDERQALLAGGATVSSSEGFRGKVKDYLSTLRIS